MLRLLDTLAPIAIGLLAIALDDLRRPRVVHECPYDDDVMSPLREVR